MKRKQKVLFLLLLLVLLTMVSGCAQANQQEGTDGTDGVAGFWPGLWQGFILPVSFIVSLFDESTGIYEIHNNGNWYDFGFILGANIVFGSILAGNKKR